MAGCIVNACIILHNLCIKYRCDLEEDENESSDDETSNDETSNDLEANCSYEINSKASEIRNQLIHTHFS